MARRATGSLYFSKGSWFLALSLEKRRALRLVTCKTRDEAEFRQAVIADMADKLKAAGKLAAADSVCRRAAKADDTTLADIARLVNGLVSGSEHVAPVVRLVPTAPSSSTTFRKFAELWTSNALADQYRRRVKRIDHADNIRRLEKHVYDVVFDGRKIGDTPLEQFGLDHADAVLAQPTLPAGSVRHVAQCIHRVLSLAVYPARVIERSPLPRGWLPPKNPEKQRSYLFPDEEQALLANARVPLVRRLFLGFCAREGPRKTNVAQLRWSDLALDLADGSGYAVIERTKNGRGISWALDPGTAEALRRWQTICPSDAWVFPADALPRHRRRNEGSHLNVGKIAETLREGLASAGVKRERLFESGENRMRLNAHDLRATFVTLALANGRSEDWVRTRTGHRSSQMVARYRREAQTVRELGLGWLKPLHEAVPELAEIDPEVGGREVQLSANCRPDQDQGESATRRVIH